MTIYTSDGEHSVNVGTGDIWYSLYSTAVVRFPKNLTERIPHAMKFLKNGECRAEDVAITNEEMNTVIKEMSSLKPDSLVYDLKKPETAPPWGSNIASSVDSCANLFTTADGDDLFTEIGKLLSYAEDSKMSICAG